jgi:hypothetical protein
MLPSPLRSPEHQGSRRAKAKGTTARRTARRSPRLQVWRGPRTDPEAHLAITRFALKRLRADLRTAAELSSDDETHFARKEARRLVRDRGRLAPIVLGAPRLSSFYVFPFYSSRSCVCLAPIVLWCALDS